MLKEDLYRFMDNPEQLNESTLIELEEILHKYPFFQAARLLYTKNLQLVNDERFTKELEKTATLCPDRSKLFYMTYPDKFSKFIDLAKAKEKNVDRTNELLDSFLSSFNKQEPDTELTNATESIISTDYISYLESLDDREAKELGNDNPLKHQDIIDAFIEKSENNTLAIGAGRMAEKPERTNSKPNNNSEQSDDQQDSSEFLTETLANIYIRQKKYDKALAIIKRLSLNYPKKNAYFADQIRFLEYLIINDKK
jgi:hypothetical protein